MKTAPYAYTFGMAAALALGATGLCAQQSASGLAQQNGSVVAAARAARDQKQQKAPPKLWDNDNLPKQGGLSVVGQEAAPAVASADAAAGAQGQPQANSKRQSTNGSKSDQPSAQSDLDGAKKQLDTLKSDLDILQRKYALDQQSYYGKTDFASDTAGAAALQDEKDQIDAKQQEIDDAQKQIDERTAKLGTTGTQPNTESN